MCGRYYVDDETAREIERLVRQADEKLQKENSFSENNCRDIHPTDSTTVIAGYDGGLLAEKKKWGFPGFGRQKVIFNARAESVLEKKMFQESILKRRIVIPAAGFYEWNRNKEKVTFFSGKKRTLFFTGCYNQLAEEDCFVILTTAANNSVKDTHERMPLFIEADEINTWLCKENAFYSILQKIPGELEMRTEYEQQSFYWK